ncbi:unnamed protein product [Phaeothamnion confervicola]
MLPPTLVPGAQPSIGHDLLGLLERVRTLRYANGQSFLLDMDSLTIRCRQVCAAHLHSRGGGPELATTLNVMVESMETLAATAKKALEREREVLAPLEAEAARRTELEHWEQTARGETHAHWRAECMPPGYTTAEALARQPPRVYLTASRGPVEWRQYLESPPLLLKSTAAPIPGGTVTINGVVLGSPPRRSAAVEDANVATALREHFAGRGGGAASGGGSSSSSGGFDGDMPPEWSEIEVAVRALHDLPRMERFVRPRFGARAGNSGVGELLESHARMVRQMLRETATMRTVWADYEEERRQWAAGTAQQPGDGHVVLGDADVVTELKVSNGSLRAANADLRADNAGLRHRIAALEAAGVAREAVTAAAATATAAVTAAAATATAAATAMAPVAPTAAAAAAAAVAAAAAAAPPAPAVLAAAFGAIGSHASIASMAPVATTASAQVLGMLPAPQVAGDSAASGGKGPESPAARVGWTAQKKVDA